MNKASRFLWLRDWRVIALASCCAVAGFVIAAVLFNARWHLAPAWGDIPTWLAFIAAAAAGGAALFQLAQQQRQITEEAKRNVKRDELLDTQLVEAKDRMDAYRRQQAENVTLTSLSIRRNRDGSVGWTGACEIVNDSGRPIREVVCRMLINGNLIQPSEFRVREEFHRVMPISEQGEATIGYLPADEGTFNPDSGEYLHLLAHRVIRVGFPVEGNDHPGSPHFLIRFLDDAKFRWQLDDDMHLLPAPDGQW